MMVIAITALSSVPAISFRSTCLSFHAFAKSRRSVDSLT